MATMKISKEPVSEETTPREKAHYNSEIDAIREKEFPMLQGMLAEVKSLKLNGSNILQKPSTSTTRAQLYTPNHS